MSRYRYHGSSPRVHRCRRWLQKQLAGLCLHAVGRHIQHPFLSQSTRHFSYLAVFVMSGNRPVRLGVTIKRWFAEERVACMTGHQNSHCADRSVEMVARGLKFLARGTFWVSNGNVRLASDNVRPASDNIRSAMTLASAMIQLVRQ